MALDTNNWAGTRVALDFEGATAIVRCFNPDQGLMDEAMEEELLQVMQRLAAWPEGRVVIVTGGQPGVFIRHYDVAVLQARASAMRARGMAFSRERLVPRAGIHEVIDAIGRSPLIFIAALNGTAMGGGFELALGCDLRVVQDGDYALGLPEVNLGLLPGAGGTQALTALLGESRAMEYMLLGRVLAPAEVVALGLAQACVPDALAHGRELARQILLRPARACAHIKTLVRGLRGESPAQREGLERTFFCDCMVDDGAQSLMRDVGAGVRRIEQPPPPLASAMDSTDSRAGGPHAID